MTKPTNLDFKNRFDSIAENYDKISNDYTVNRRIESLQTKKNGLVLEVGAATGAITKNLKNIVICTDISFNMCRQTKIKRENVVCCDAEMLPFKLEQFDAIISAEMIYYLDKPQKFLEDSYLLLKKNGEILISMTNSKMNFVDKVRTKLRKCGLSKMYFDDGLKNFMKIETLKLFLEKQNFNVESIEKKVILPYTFFDKVNRFFEKTILNRFGIFIIIKAKK